MSKISISLTKILLRSVTLALKNIELFLHDTEYMLCNLCRMNYYTQKIEPYFYQQKKLISNF